jgi:predicted DNA-binding transcriptional regulator YafY
MRIDRMLSITVMLLNKDRISARELAEKFEVSIRTIYRDIEAINLAGIPVISYQGNNGGFGIMENYKIDRQVLTLKDMLAIISALKGINITLEDRELDTAIEKISSLVPKDKTEDLNRHLEQFIIDILPWGYGKKQKDQIKVIHDSIISNRLLIFVYRNAKGEVIERIVEPMTLVFKGYCWFLFSYCLIRKDFRIFRLSRMRNIRLLDKGFIRREASFQDYYQESINPDGGKVKMAHLVLKFSPEVRFRVEDCFDEEQIRIQDNGDLIVRVSFPEDQWVYSMILSYGENVVVLEPGHIREIILKKVNKIQGIYKPDSMVSQE